MSCNLRAITNSYASVLQKFLFVQTSPSPLSLPRRLDGADVSNLLDSLYPKDLLNPSPRCGGDEKRPIQKQKFLSSHIVEERSSTDQQVEAGSHE